MELNFNLHKKQGVAFKSPATEILYGGAAGGGKSHLMRVQAIVPSLEIPGLQTYLFRRQYPDLIANHIDGPGGIPMMLSELIANKKATFNQSKMEVEFWNSSKIHLCHCQHEKDVIKYQGAEIHQLLMDELTHFTEHQYRFLRGRVRLGGLNVPAKYKATFPRVLAGSNPGSIGHAWVKRTFVDFQPAYELTRTEPEEGGLVRQYIPALLEDNPTLTQNDPDYETRLMGLGSPDLVKAMRYGLWDITAGQALEKLSRERHMLRRFIPPDHWTRVMVIDWGSAKPFSIGWYVIPDVDFELAAKDHWPKRVIPKNSIIRYREWYGWNGKPNEGCRMDSSEVVKRILEIEDDAGERIDYRVGDSSMWSSEDGPSTEEKMFTASKGRFIMEKSIKDRINNYQNFRDVLVGDDGYPMFYVTESCTHFWRTLPDLQLDELHPEKGPDTEQEDHCYDECVYMIASRPMPTSKRQRVASEIQAIKRKQGRGQEKRRGY